jgi:hypothetical protein
LSDPIGLHGIIVVLADIDALSWSDQTTTTKTGSITLAKSAVIQFNIGYIGTSNIGRGPTKNCSSY